MSYELVFGVDSVIHFELGLVVETSPEVASL
jgi:hypothetical protein